ncbi:phospho-N-acetylmuramoyl-pentapeptide-transferase [Blattabacterium cuenoti]|uniref:phospho-N-acetylmuramoyl-pentapeptide- transferase n=1 Tax=Blattabacterium cuenoti TaxID=1653831 RepID=UPI001EEADAB9|nr:phospho-N-acetylmuramoyl-pentapeptide-transferase [Blattabacterium cuenoti]
MKNNDNFLFESLNSCFLLININYVFFRAVVSFFLSFFIALIFYKKFIYWNNAKNNIREHIRDLGLIGQREKEGTPTMGGVIMILSTLISTMLFSSLKNKYVFILVLTTFCMGCIGFLDDYIKIKYNKKGLSVTGKVLGQILVGILIGNNIYFLNINSNESIKKVNSKFFRKKEYSIKTTFPFSLSNQGNEFDYSCILNRYNKKWKKYIWIIFIPMVIFTITFLSNGANLTDGIDGLTAGISSIIFFTLSLISIISSNKIFSSNFNLIYIPHLEEIIIFSFAFIGSLISFLWYNTYPAQIFMGDTGSLTIGGAIATITIINRKELILPILCGIFFMENISVIIQVLYFKFSKKKYGIGKRIFLMAPLHHHFQKLGYHENKIFIRFIIIQIILSILTVILLIK